MTFGQPYVPSNYRPVATSSMTPGSHPLGQSGGSSSEPPKKVFENGSYKINPAWKEWKKQQKEKGDHLGVHSIVETKGESARNRAETHLGDLALVPVSTVREAQEAGLELSDQATNFVEIAEDIWEEEYPGLGDISIKVQDWADRNNASLGLLNRSAHLEERQLYFIFDDSASMREKTDCYFREESGLVRQMNRFDEAEQFLLRVIEFLPLIPTGDIHISFLHYRDQQPVVSITSEMRASSSPEAIIERASVELREGVAAANRGIDQRFRNVNSRADTPLVPALKNILSRIKDAKANIYFLDDGLPNAGGNPQDFISVLKAHRNSYPSGEPCFGFRSCTNNDDDVYHHKTADVFISNCDESDDRRDEQVEMWLNQGCVGELSEGDHLLKFLLGPCDREIDGMDDPLPPKKGALGLKYGFDVSDHQFDEIWQLFNNARFQREDRQIIDYLEEYEGSDFATAYREAKGKVESSRNQPLTELLARSFDFRPYYDVFKNGSSGQVLPVEQFYRDLMHECAMLDLSPQSARRQAHRFGGLRSESRSRFSMEVDALRSGAWNPQKHQPKEGYNASIDLKKPTDINRLGQDDFRQVFTESRGQGQGGSFFV